MQSALQQRTSAPRAGAARLTAGGARRAAVVSRAGATLYASPGSRSRVCEWYARELGLSDAQFTIKNLDMRGKQEHKDPQYIANVHPFGQVPALVNDDVSPPFAVFESGAILLYMGEKYGALKTPEERAQAAQWVSFANATLGQAIFFTQERSLPSVLEGLDRLLADRQFLTGDEFSVADIAVGAYFAWIPRFFGDQINLKPYKNVVAYSERVLSRPAAKATILA